LIKAAAQSPDFAPERGRFASCGGPGHNGAFGLVCGPDSAFSAAMPGRTPQDGKNVRELIPTVHPVVHPVSARGIEGIHMVFHGFP
jgi:hypothetical protein